MTSVVLIWHDYQCNEMLAHPLASTEYTPETRVTHHPCSSGEELLQIISSELRAHKEFMKNVTPANRRVSVLHQVVPTP